MATNANPFVVNLVDLQNIANTITGENTLQQLQIDVANLQEMVIFDTKTIAADTITNFTTPGAPVQFTTSITNTASTNQGTLAFKYASGSFLGGVSGSQPSSVLSVTAAGTTITLTTTYSTSNFPNYIGTILWYNGTNYMSFTIPNMVNTMFTPSGSEIVISGLTDTALTGVQPDSSGDSIWLALTFFN